MRHASVVIYPTSAEGFGIVPFEAARLGTPTVGVSFGPLREVNPDLPVSSNWLAAGRSGVGDGALLSDPALADRQVRQTVSNGAEYSWARTAAGHVHVYRSLLSMPARWPHRR